MRILKLIWILWVSMMCLWTCEHAKTGNGYVPKVYGAEAPVYYMIKEGDTLSKLARMFDTTVEKFLEANPQIVDKNIIYAGTKLWLPLVGPIEPLTREERIERLALFMYKKAVIPSSRKIDAKDAIAYHHEAFSSYGLDNLDNQRRNALAFVTWTRSYEIWLLAEAIVDLTIDHEEFCKIVGLAWQESHFVNKRGEHGEVSFFQFYPPTIKERFDLDEVGLNLALYELENNPKLATSLAIDMMRSYDWKWHWWNGGPNYKYYLEKKIAVVRKEFTRSRK